MTNIQASDHFQCDANNKCAQSGKEGKITELNAIFQNSRTWRPAEMVVEYLKEWLKVMFGDLVKWEDGSVMSQLCLYSMTPDVDYVIDFLGVGLVRIWFSIASEEGFGFSRTETVPTVPLQECNMTESLL
ncbi:FAD-dependent oxidoreductase family protein [Artemisia annua]|uniref:FAD-dependent oxidoreductase family protein n=1 Tax=Artemisia annua TaxID=35608 RepID=A0A2U1LB93_ARTAN|nr:FAD-dependent oxidoreductase family protein [Artemisia annua]